MSLPIKNIPESAKQYLSPKEECKHIKSQGLFHKTYNVLTNKRMLVIKKGALISENSFVSQDEENVSITRDLTLITTKRLIALSKKEENRYEKDFDFPYTASHENYVSHELKPLLTLGGNLTSDDSDLISFHILTNHRLLFLSNRKNMFKQISSINAKDIETVDFGRVKAGGLSHPATIISLKKIESPLLILKGDLHNRESAEFFPNKIAGVAGVAFAPPKQISKDNTGTYIESYVKSNMKWPYKCCKCGKSDVDLSYRILKVEKTIQFDQTTFPAPSSVDLKVPYCSNCGLGKAVKSEAFDGVRTTLKFTNNDYAIEWIQMNNISSNSN